MVDRLSGIATGASRDTTGSGNGSSRSCLLLCGLVALAPRALDGVLGNLHNLASPPLLAIGALRQRGMNRRQGSQHGLIKRSLVGVNGRRVLTKVVKTRERLATVARERTLASVFAAM